MVIPAVIVAGMMLIPLLYLIVRSAQADPADWAELLTPRRLEVVANSGLLALTVTGGAVLIAVPLAYITTRTDIPARRFWSILSVLPLAIPSYIGAFAYISALGPRGLVQQYLAEPLGIESIPSIYGFFGSWLVLTLFTYPYVLLTIRGALSQLDPDLEDAARSLGDSPLRAFIRVTVPQLRPAIAAGGLLVAFYTLSDFGAVSMLRFTTFTRAIYVQYTSSFNRTIAAMLALVLVAMTLIILFFEGRARGKTVIGGGRSTKRKPRPLELGRWRWLAIGYCALIGLLTIGIPLLVIGTWFVIGWRTGGLLEVDLLGPAWRSILASGLAALAGLLAAVPVAFFVVRYRSTFSKLLERISYIGNALPGVVIGLALVFFGANFALPLYQTLAMLIFAYVVRFLPQAVGALETSLQQISPQVEEAGRGLGRSRLYVWWTVTLPLLRPGMLSAAALVFLTAMKELPATLLLAPIEYDTLATRVWSATTEAFYGRAAPVALLLLIVSALSIGFLVDHDE